MMEVTTHLKDQQSSFFLVGSAIPFFESLALDYFVFAVDKAFFVLLTYHN